MTYEWYKYKDGQKCNSRDNIVGSFACRNCMMCLGFDVESRCVKCKISEFALEEIPVGWYLVKRPCKISEQQSPWGDCRLVEVEFEQVLYFDGKDFLHGKQSPFHSVGDYSTIKIIKRVDV